MHTHLVTPWRFVLTAALMAGAAMAAPIAVQACPIEPYDPDRVVAAIAQTASCKAAYDLMNECRRNNSGDVELAQTVIAKCEKSFVTRGASPRMKAYAEDKAACVRKYAGKQGTMYTSFRATCEAGVAAKYAR